jgi:hypothetical protein
MLQEAHSQASTRFLVPSFPSRAFVSKPSMVEDCSNLLLNAIVPSYRSTCLPNSLLMFAACADALLWLVQAAAVEAETV